jgi:gas vesicle protein
MNDRMRIVGGGLLGAAIGSMAAYLLLTEDGRSKLGRMKPAVDELSHVLHDVRGTIMKLGEVAIEGRRAMSEVRAAFSSAETARMDRWQ